MIFGFLFCFLWAMEFQFSLVHLCNVKISDIVLLSYRWSLFKSFGGWGGFLVCFAPAQYVDVHPPKKIPNPQVYFFVLDFYFGSVYRIFFKIVHL
jgi:hypothetical protein